MIPREQELKGALQQGAVPAQSWALELEANHQACIRGTRALTAWCVMLGIGPACRARIATASAELLDNASRHAYPAARGTIRLSASKLERELFVTIEDFGSGLPAERPEPAASGGGLTRAASLCEGMQLDSAPGAGTSARLTFCIYQVFFEEEDRVDLSDLDYLPPATARTLLERIHRTGAHDSFYLSPALATTVGRLLIGPDGCRSADASLRS